MKSLPKNLLTVFLCLCLLIGSGGLAESGSAADAQEEELQYRFGLEAEVTLDQDGNPALVNGFPFRTATASYYDGGQHKVFDFDADILDYPFYRASTAYDGNLAAMSLAMALSASRMPDGGSGETEKEADSALNMETFLPEAGFTDIRVDDYSKVTSMYTVATAMGCRRMEAEGEEPFTLIAIGVCGSGYKNEWQSNMSPGQGDIHKGFLEAANLVVDRLAGYIATRGFHGRLKVWISGFSRAAAVSNLAAAVMTDTGMMPKENVYAYTFTTPAAVKNPPETGYEHIFNILCPTDLIPPGHARGLGLWPVRPGSVSARAGVFLFFRRGSDKPAGGG
ncbi:MAG: hypothetical protein IKH30_01320 [Clostridia bacterium]|nr:hypothetical protein [Clostridia bacterium]